MGPGLAYQRFLWRNLYAAVHGAWMSQTYFDSAGKKLSQGEQLFLTFRLGYHIEFGGRLFIEPSVAATHWPINTGLPSSFQEKERGTPKSTVEPGFHVGWIF